MVDSALPLDPSSRHLLRLVTTILICLGSCRRSDPIVPATKDCGEDFSCLVQRARSCQPATALLSQEFNVDGRSVRALSRYEVVGRVQGQCHVRRTQVDPPPPPLPPDTAPERAPGQLPLLRNYEEIPPTPKLRPGEWPLPLMQCLYPEGQAAEVLRRVQRGASTQEDLDLCYPGAGGCYNTPLPLLRPGCVLGDCLLGRWTFTCERTEGGRPTIHKCMGTRISDENPTCFVLCKAGQYELDCRQMEGQPFPQE